MILHVSTYIITSVCQFQFYLNINLLLVFSVSGKRFGGFDSIDNLISKELVKREATVQPTYALTQTGIELAKRLMKFHAAVKNVMKEFQVPSVPQHDVAK